MALTLVAKTIDPNGTGDYTSLNGAEAANFGASNADLTVSDEYCVLTCICTGGTADTTAVTIAGQTTGGTRTITVTVGAAYRHNGTYQTGNKDRLEKSNDTALVVTTNNVTLDGLQVQLTATATSVHAIWVKNCAAATLTNCIAVGVLSGSANVNFGFDVYADAAGTRVVKLANCIAYNFATTNGRGFSSDQEAGTLTTYFYNCTAVTCTIGFRNVWGTGVYLKNNISSSTTDYSGAQAFNAASTNNIGAAAATLAFGATRTTGTTTSATAGKLNDTNKNFITLGVRVGTVIKNTTDTTYTYVTAVDSATVLSVNDNIFANAENYSIYYNLKGAPTFVNAGAGNYHLVAGAANIAYRTGADLDADAALAVTTDIDGQTRHATTPCIGFDEVSDWDTTLAAITTKAPTLVGAVTVTPAALSPAGRNAALDAIAALTATGAGTATLVWENAANAALCTCNMNATPFAAASASSMAANAIVSGTVLVADTIDHLACYNKDAALVITFTAATSGAEATIPTVTPSAGDQISISSILVTMPPG